MGSLTTRPTTMARGDAISLGALMLAGAGIAAWTIAGSAGRIAELVGGGPVRVRTQLSAAETVATIGSGTPALSVEVESALLVVPEPTMTTIVPLALEQALLALLVLLVVGCLLALATSIVRGRVFSRANTRLVSVAGAAALLGAWLVPLCSTVAANDAIAQLAAPGLDGVVFAVEPFALVSIAFVVAIGVVTFGVGDRLQRDTEGLV